LAHGCRLCGEPTSLSQMMGARRACAAGKVMDDAARDRPIRAGTVRLALLTMWASRGSAKMGPCLAERPADGEELTESVNLSGAPLGGFY